MGKRTFVDVVAQPAHLGRFLPVLFEPLFLKPDRVAQDHRVGLGRPHDVLDLAVLLVKVARHEADETPWTTALVGVDELLVAPLEDIAPQDHVVVHDHDGASVDLLVPVERRAEALVHAVALALAH